MNWREVLFGFTLGVARDKLRGLHRADSGAKLFSLLGCHGLPFSLGRRRLPLECMGPPLIWECNAPLCLSAAEVKGAADRNKRKAEKKNKKAKKAKKCRKSKRRK